MKILVVEDDRKVAGFIEQGLREEGYAVDVAPDGDEATMLAHVYEYDLLVLDVMLPKKTGLQVAAELRREGSKTPILMLTARDATEDVVRGLDAGADDYLTKPFKFEELLARVRALVRRGGASRTELLSYGPVQVDRLKHKATINGKRLDLTPKEFQLLEHFMLRPEEVLRRTVRPRKQRGGRARGEPAPQAKRRGGRGGDPHRARGGVPVGDTGSGGLVSQRFVAHPRAGLKISSPCFHHARARPAANCFLQTEFQTSDQERLCHATSGRSSSSAR